MSSNTTSTTASASDPHPEQPVEGNAANSDSRLVITVLDSATIFEGAETVYRYDLPGKGIVEGWALSEAMDQIAKSCGAQWPESILEICVDSSSTAVSYEAVEILARQCAAAGAQLSIDVGQPQHGAAPETLQEDKEPKAPSRQSDGAHSLRGTNWKGLTGPARLLRQIDLFHLAIATVVLGVAAVSWWALGLKAEAETTPSAQDSEAPSPQAITDSPEAETALGEEAGEDLGAGASLEDSDSPDLESLRIEAEGISVALPSGFHISVDQGLITATGEDPDLRVLLAADPLFQVPPEMLFQELRAEIEREETLDESVEHAGRLSYKELPGDGSQVAWTTWTDLGHQLSVGCHTKVEPTVVQKATCRMATESLRKLE